MEGGKQGPDLVESSRLLVQRSGDFFLKDDFCCCVQNGLRGQGCKQEDQF